MVILVLDELLLLPRRFFLLLPPRPALLGSMGAEVEEVVVQLLTEVMGFFFKLLKESRRGFGAETMVDVVEDVVVTPWPLDLEDAGSGITG